MKKNSFATGGSGRFGSEERGSASGASVWRTLSAKGITWLVHAYARIKEEFLLHIGQWLIV